MASAMLVSSAVLGLRLPARPVRARAAAKPVASIKPVASVKTQVAAPLLKQEAASVAMASAMLATLASAPAAEVRRCRCSGAAEQRGGAARDMSQP